MVLFVGSMSSLYSRRKRSSSFGSYGAYRAIEKPADLKPELIEGYAHICFDDQALWFRGILLTAEGQSYNLNGERILISEEDVKIDESDGPDVIRDFPSPILTSSKGSLGSSDSSSAAPSRKNSIDSQPEKELQFNLEDSNKASPDQSPLTSQSPPSTQQIIKALDSLIITTNKMSSISEHKIEEDKESPILSPVLSPSGFDSPFRSRSGSRNKQNIETIPVSFDIVITDLEEGTQHKIRHVTGRKGSALTLRSKQLCFMTEKAFWGQRAVMVIQKQLAVPELVGQKCHVYAGPMRFYVTPRTFEARSLTNWCW